MIELLKTQVNLIGTIINSIGDAVVACDPSGKFIIYNAVAEKILGPKNISEKPEKWSKDFGAFLPDKITPFPQEWHPLLRGLKGEETNDVEQFVKNSHKPEGVFISITGRPIRDESGAILGSVVVVRDISRRKKSEEDLVAANALLKEKNIELVAVNKELESFSYAVSHDLRTPLRSIIGFSDILIKKHSSQLSPEALDLQNRVKDSGHKLGQLIDGLLDLSRLTRENIRKESISLSDIARSVSQDLMNQAPDRQVHFKIPEGIKANGDERLLRSVMLNLMGNAWKFTSKKPKAEIEFGTTHAQDGTEVYFVKDNGAGFNDKYSNKLFTIFQRLHGVQEFEGNGIGLATVQRIISRHGGKIWAEGKPDQGATFFFTV